MSQESSPIPDLQPGQEILFTPLRLVRHFGPELIEGKTVSLEALVFVPDIPGYSIICQQGERGLTMMNALRKDVSEHMWKYFYVTEGVGDEIFFMRPRRLSENPKQLTEAEQTSLIRLSLDIQVMYEQKLEEFPDIKSLILKEYDDEIPLVHIGVDYSRNNYDTFMMTLLQLGDRLEIATAGRLNYAKQVAKQEFIASITETNEVPLVREDGDEELAEFPITQGNIPDYIDLFRDKGLDIIIENGHLRISIPKQFRQYILEYRNELFRNFFSPIENPQIHRSELKPTVYSVYEVATTDKRLQPYYSALVPSFIREGKLRPEHLDTHTGEALFLNLDGLEKLTDIVTWSKITKNSRITSVDYAQIKGTVLRFFAESAAKKLFSTGWDVDQTEVMFDHSLRLFAYHNILTPTPLGETTPYDRTKSIFYGAVEAIGEISSEQYKYDFLKHIRLYLSQRNISYHHTMLEEYIFSTQLHPSAGLGSCMFDNLTVAINERGDKNYPDGFVLIGGKLPSYVSRIANIVRHQHERFHPFLDKAPYIVVQNKLRKILDIPEYAAINRSLHLKGFNGTKYDISVISIPRL